MAPVVNNVIEKKNVSFNKKVEIYTVPLKDECRQKYWELVALDNERFKRNILRKSSTISRILQNTHRINIIEYIQQQRERSETFNEIVKKMTPILNNIILQHKHIIYKDKKQ